MFLDKQKKKKKEKLRRETHKGEKRGNWYRKVLSSYRPPVDFDGPERSLRDIAFPFHMLFPLAFSSLDLFYLYECLRFLWGFFFLFTQVFLLTFYLPNAAHSPSLFFYLIKKRRCQLPTLSEYVISKQPTTSKYFFVKLYSNSSNYIEE